MDTELANRLTETLPRNLIIELMEMTEARAREAHELIRDHTRLKGKNARGAEGQLRFRTLEDSFEEICKKYGAHTLANGKMGKKTIRFYQPYMRFGEGSSGLVLGFSSMPNKGELPSKNKSRMAGAEMNYNLTPRLQLDENDPRVGDIFIMFLAARDPSQSGKIAEIAIGVIDTNYATFISYMTVEKFLALYAVPDKEARKEAPKLRLVKLKGTRKTYKAPEAPDDEDKETNET